MIANIFLTYQTFVPNLHLLRVELRCKLQEKLQYSSVCLLLSCYTIHSLFCHGRSAHLSLLFINFYFSTILQN